MRPILPFLIVATGLAAAHDAAAQVVAPAAGPGAALSGAAAGVTFPLTHDQVSDLQQKLNAAGFSSGYVDGRWGPITATALMNFQRRHGLAPDGHLTPATVAALDAAAPAARQASAGTAAVQPSGARQPASAVVAAVPPADGSAAVGIDAAPPAAPVTTGPSGGSGGTAASGGSAAAPPLQATAGGLQPLSGANSFTPGEARRRIERNGFSQVSDLHRDGDGVWRGHAMKSGQRVAVWLDYKGNVGQP